MSFSPAGEKALCEFYGSEMLYRKSDAKEEYKSVVEAQKKRVMMAREKRDDVKHRFKQEQTRRKQEIAAAKARTKAVVEQHKSAVAEAKAEIARIKSEAPKRR